MEDYGTMTVTFGVLDMNIDNEIIDNILVHIVVRMTWRITGQ
jgi:hypothetical protein